MIEIEEALTVVPVDESRLALQSSDSRGIPNECDVQRFVRITIWIVVRRLETLMDEEAMDSTEILELKRIWADLHSLIADGSPRYLLKILDDERTEPRNVTAGANISRAQSSLIDALKMAGSCRRYLG